MSGPESRTLLGRRALVTGAGIRVGRAIALELARHGCDIVVHVNGSRGPGEETVAAIRDLGREAHLVVADQRDVAAVQRAVAEAEEQAGPLDGLVNSAAIWPHVAVEDIEVEDFDLALEVNLRGPFFWAKEVGVRMRERGRGAIVNIADVSVDRPWPDSLPYCLAKAGVESMTYGLAKALAPAVRVNAIGPGPVLFPPNYPQERVDADRAATLRGVEGSPEDIAHAVRFLFEAENVTGVLLPVDGGYRFGI